MALISSRTGLGCTLSLASVLFLSMNSAFSLSFCSTFSLWTGIRMVTNNCATESVFVLDSLLPKKFLHYF